MRPTPLVSLALAALFAGGAVAQVPTPTGGSAPAADPSDVQSLDAILGALYNVISGPAGEARDWDRFRSLFVDGARLIPTGVPEGSETARARLLSVEDYVAASGPVIEQRGFFESEIGRVVEEFGTIAHAFSTYESRWTPDGEVFQRGINSLQLLFDRERWWIVGVLWRGVGPEEEIPVRYVRR